MKAAFLLGALTVLCSCAPVSPYLLPPGGITVGFTRASVEGILGRPAEEMSLAEKRFYIYKQLQWVNNSEQDIYETLFWIIEFDAGDRVADIATLQGSFFSSTSRAARRWVKKRTRHRTPGKVNTR